MEIYLASAAGLLSWCGEWRKIPTPLAHPTLLAPCGAGVALADSVSHQLYRAGRISALPPGVEVLCSWRNHLLTLSSETNCLTLYDAHDNPLVTSPAGIRPCGCTLCGSHAIVCGCEDGCLHIFSLPDLQETATYPVPGCPMRVAADGGLLTCLSLLNPDPPQTLLFRLNLTSGDFAPVALLPGWCGAVTIAADRTIWAGVGEQLLHFPLDSVVPDVRLGGFGLICSLSCQQSQLLIGDPWTGRCLLMDAFPPYTLHTLYVENAGNAALHHAEKGRSPTGKRP